LFGGAHADKLFNSIKTTLEGRSDRVWKDLVAAERRFTDDGSHRGENLKYGRNLRTYAHTSLALVSDEKINTYKTKTENWGQKFIRFLLVNNISPLHGMYNITLAILNSNITI